MTSPRPRPDLALRLAALTSAVSLATAAATRGRVHPDEIFQALEPAHRAAFGYGVVAWEWTEGLRNRVLVDLLAGVLRGCSALGLEQPTAWLAVIWLLLSLWQGVGTWALYRLVEEHEGPGPAGLAALLHATWGGYAVYAARPLADPLAIPALLLALRFALRGEGAADGLRSGLALGAAAVLRYPSLVFAAPLGLGLLVRRRLGPVAGFAFALASVGLALGALDLHDWGQPFHSLRAYLAYNQPRGQVVRSFGALPWWWYGPVFCGMAPWFLGWGLARGLRHPDLRAACFLAYAAALELHPHREARFLLPLLPLGLSIAAGPAWADLLWLWRRRPGWAPWATAGYLLWSGISATLTRPFDFGAPVLAAEQAAAAEPGFRGLAVTSTPWWDTGGYFYLHRDRPLTFVDTSDPAAQERALADPAYSHLLVEGPAPAEARVLAAGWSVAWRRGPVVLWRRAAPPR